MLSDSEKTDMADYFEKVATAQNKDVDAVIADFENALETALIAPSMQNKSRKRQIKRAKSILSTNYSNSKTSGEPFVFWPFGYIGSVKDWNDVIFAHNEAELQRGNMAGLVQEGRVMLFNGEPVTKILEKEAVTRYINPETDDVSDTPQDGYEKLDGCYKITKAEKWHRGQIPIWRDHRPSNRGKINFGYDRPLRHSWRLTMVGIAYPQEDEDYRLFECNLRYEQADPGSKEFFFKKFKPFSSYIANFEVDENKTKDWRYVLKTKAKLTPKAFTPVFAEGIDTLDDMIESVFEILHEEYDDQVAKIKVGKGFDQLPDFLEGFSELEEYHTGNGGFSGAAVMLDDVRAEKTPSNWDRMLWNKYAIMTCKVDSANEPSTPTSSYSYNLIEATSKRPLKVWAGDAIFSQPELPGECIMMIKTGRRPDRYDPITKKKVPDSVHGDLSVTAISIARLEPNKKPTEEEMEDVKVVV